MTGVLQIFFAAGSLVCVVMLCVITLCKDKDDDVDGFLMVLFTLAMLFMIAARSM